MHNYVLKSCAIIVRKSTLILSSSFNVLAKSHGCTNVQKLLKVSYIKRDFYKSATNYYVIKYLSKAEKDVIDNEQLNEILKNSEKDKLYKLIQFEMEYMKLSNEKVPSSMRPKDWIYLLKLPSKSQRRKYLQFLFINEMKGLNKKEKHQIAKEARLKEMEEKFSECPSGLEYGLGKNNLFLRIYDKTIDGFFNYKMILSMLYEPKIVFDCGYEDVMSPQELINCAKQLSICLSLNRVHSTPAPFYFCDAPKTNKMIEILHQMVPNLYEDNFPIELTPKSYLDIFDKDKLVYLTPHCRKEMRAYDPDKVYIIGALVDRANPQPYSLAKAKKEGIAMERLPLDVYYQWSTGSNKSLTLNQVLAILLDIKYTKDWRIALDNNVPKRKTKQITVPTDISSRKFFKRKQNK